MYSTGCTDTRQNIKLISYDDYTRRVWSQETHMGKKKNCIREPRQNPGGDRSQTRSRRPRPASGPLRHSIISFLATEKGHCGESLITTRSPLKE